MKIHGTVNGYWNYDCRCARCRKALREYNQARRIRNFRHAEAAGGVALDQVDRFIAQSRLPEKYRV